MIEYLGRLIPDDEAELKELIRQEAHRVMSEDRRDGRPAGALDWVSGLVASYPELLERVERIYEQLLVEADPIEVREILWQGDQHPKEAGFAHVVAQAIAIASDALKRGADTTQEDRSLLGSAVASLASQLRQGAALPMDAVRALGEIDSPRDGWPQSLVLALGADYDGYSKRLLPTLDRLRADDEMFDRFVTELVNSGPPITTRGFEDIGRAAPDVRNHFANTVEGFLRRAEETRQDLIRLGVADRAPSDVKQRILQNRPYDAWADLSKRLGVSKK